MEIHGCEMRTSWNLEQFRGVSCTLGIDEAGRGPVLGPMVYAIGVCRTDQLDRLKTLNVADSKELTEQQREEIFEQINDPEGDTKDYFAYALRTMSAQYISRSMLQRIKYNLNEVSHESAMKLIETCLNHGIEIDAIFVDTVGPSESYQEKLCKRFPNVGKILVSKKADSLYPIVSAASICAKVTRDRAVNGWRFVEGQEVVKVLDSGYGSGYPGDPATKTFLQQNVHTIFGFPSFVRFSWSTAEEIIAKRCVKVSWDDDNVKPEAIGTKSILSFFARTKRPAPGAMTNGNEENQRKMAKVEIVEKTIFDELGLHKVNMF